MTPLFNGWTIPLTLFYRRKHKEEFRLAFDFKFRENLSFRQKFPKSLQGFDAILVKKMPSSGR
jgi:hypothetical protein